MDLAWQELSQKELLRQKALLDAAKWSRLQEVQDGIASLQAKYDECVRKKDELETKCTECEQRLLSVPTR